MIEKPKTNEINDAEINDASRTYIISSRLSASAKEQLSTLVNDLWLKLQTASSAAIAKVREAQESPTKELSFDDYTQTRNSFYQAAYVAIMCDHKNRADVLKKWGEFQIAHLNYTIDFLENKREDIETTLSAHQENVDELTPFEARYASKWKAFSNKTPDDTEMKELDTLRRKVRDLESSRTELELYTNAHKIFDKSVEDIKKIKTLPLLEQIGYDVLPPKVIFELLQKGTYTGLGFQKFNVLADGEPFLSTAKKIDNKSNSKDFDLEAAIATPAQKTSNATAAARATPTAAQQHFVNPTEKPKELIALLELKHAVNKYTSDKQFSGADILDTLPSDYLFGVKIIGSYLETLPELFGVTPQREKTLRRFIKSNSNPISEDEFIHEIIQKLRPEERSALNKFYLKRALGRIREDPKIGYGRFNDKQVREKINEDGLTMELKTIATNLVKLRLEYGVSVLEPKDWERQYEFSEINPTSNETVRVAETTKLFGYDQFSSNDLCRRISEQKQQPMHPRLVEFVLKTNYESLGLRKIVLADKTLYETLDRPKSATQLVQTLETTVDMGPLV